MKEKNVYTLDDTNVHPSSAALQFISRHPQSPALISTLLHSNSVTITALHQELRITPLLSVDETDRSYLVSFLYYLGALTHAPSEATDSIELRIPNEQSRKEYLLELRHLFDIINHRLSDLRATVTQMFTGDIGPLCAFIQAHFLDLQKYNDVIHSMEHTLKSVFILAVSVARGPDNTFSEYAISQTQADAVFLGCGDDSSPIVHIEFKNTTVGHIAGQYNTRDWQKMNKFSKKLSEMPQNELLALPLAGKCRSWDKHLRRQPNDVKDMWTIVQTQAKENCESLYKKHPGRTVISYVVYRIGLQRLLYERMK